MKKKGTIFVGLSGGVDSSVAALRLIREGYTVLGVFIKVWQPDFITCNWERERLDAMRVAAQLDIPFRTFDAEDAYKKEVADYMITEYKAGRTPNPDVMCNQFVKFGVFLEYALREGADKVATGHYARIQDVDGVPVLFRGADEAKDQSYFLWSLTQKQREHIIFPIGDMTKDAVRKQAKSAGLITAEKHDSQGICFLGQVDMKEFLSHYVDVVPGDVLDLNGKAIGAHNGALFYTNGQRHGFVVTHAESVPYYVVSKDLKRNTITVDIKPSTLEQRTIRIDSINEALPFAKYPECLAQFRYRQTPVRVQLSKEDNEHAILNVLTKTETPSSGQSCVLYKNDTCVGGGIITFQNADNKS
jgi:tRNA-specific 2-thiouridylase